MSQQSSAPGFNDYIPPADMPAQYALNGKIMAVAIVLFFLFVFFILIIHVCTKCWWSNSSSRRGLAFTSSRSTHIHTGLDKAIIEQLPTFIYKTSSSSAEEGDAMPSLECAVCLNEFQENEKCTMLPSCKHTFHTECIDMWFFSHSTCPLCRTSVIPASPDASSATPSSSHEQHQGGEQQVAIEASQDATESSHVASSPAQYPCNVLFWGNQAQVSSSQEPSSLSSPSSLPSFTPPTRCLPQIAIDIPPMEGNFVASTAGSPSSKSTSHMTEQAACSSQTPKSPGLRASIKRMLSRQSSRHRSSNQEGNEEASK